MLPSQSQLMYFTDLFAEINTAGPTEPQINSAATVPAQFDVPPPSSQTQPGSHLIPQNPTEHAIPQLNHLLKTEEFSFANGDEEEDDADEENGDATRRQSPPAPTAAAASTAELQPTSQSPEKPAGKRRKQELHRRHSKRYRDNLGELFHELELILPQVIPDCKLKTKSQIIANSVNAVRQLKLEVSTLEMRYVMSSPANRAKWVDEVVTKAVVLQDAIEPFMRLLLGLQSWKHSELWMRVDVSQGRQPYNSFALHLERVTSAAVSHTSEHFQEFVKSSEFMTFAAGDDSMVGRIATTLSPEWIDLKDKGSLTGFKRGELALRCGLVVCFAVPFLVRGHVAAVVLFYGNQPRVDTQQRVSVAQDLASAIGNCYGSLASKKDSTG